MAEVVVPNASKWDEAWWREAIVYQIYPSSFCDSNDDGVGDLNGIASKLDYLKSLGVDVVWLSPIYKSPQKDMGYDISDYRDIHEEYGTLEDWERLVEGLHQRGMKLMMDLVVNHTSDQHAWFQSSRSSKDDPKRDWYFWRPAKYDEKTGERKPPNNWMCAFRGGPAWSWDEKTQEYYLRLYVEEQPDLNWDNPAVRHEVHELMKFWLDKGADGFRMDVINLISKTQGLPDATVTEPDQDYQPPWEHCANGPNVHKYIRELNDEVLSKYKIITVGETPFTHDAETLTRYVLPENKELQMVFTFEHMDVDGDLTSPMKKRPWKLGALKEVHNRFQNDMYRLGGWNSLYLENHDQARSVSRFGNDSAEYRAISAKMLALFHCTLSGSVFIYQGQEIAVKNMPSTWTIEDLPDIATITYFNEQREMRKKSTGESDPDMSDIMDGIRHKARDNARMPMPWSAAPHAGFTGPNSKGPWMRINEDWKEWNVESQVDDPESVLSFWKTTLAFRKANKACTYGRFELVDEPNAKVFAFIKEHPSQTLLVLVNFTSSQVAFDLPSSVADGAEVVFGNYDGAIGKKAQGPTAELKPYEARVYKIA